MYPESDLLAISGLQHLIFCQRQWALIHLEQVWVENRLTVEGRHLHDRVDQPEHETRGNVRTVRALPLRSLELGITGRADVVEFHYSDGVTPSPLSAPCAVFPVEYKRGKPKPDRCDEVQLCAQALCIEEMLGVTVTDSALYYGKPRRRHPVAISDDLRRFTRDTILRMHQLYAARVTPQVAYQPKCENCSLIQICLPKSTGSRQSAAAYLKSSIAETQTTIGG